MSRKRLQTLLFRLGQIQKQIEREQSARWSCWLRLLKLKRLRLTVQDQMARLFAHNPDPALVPVRIRSGVGQIPKRRQC